MFVAGAAIGGAINVSAKDMEERLIRVICQGGFSAELRDEMVFRLRSYAFGSVYHQVIFDCLSGLARQEPETIRNLLPERLVRAGFPDLDVAPFFEPHGLPAQEVRKILARLTGVTQSQETEAGV